MNNYIFEEKENLIFNCYFEYTQIAKEKNANKFLNKLKKVKDKTKGNIKNKIESLINRLNSKDIDKVLGAILIAKNDKSAYKENKIVDSLKDMASNMFPSLSFYPALKVWTILDKVVGDVGLTTLNPTEKNTLILYTAVFFGIVGAKVAKDRIKEMIKKRKDELKESGKTKEVETKKPILRRVK